jgi:amino acid transporter
MTRGLHDHEPRPREDEGNRRSHGAKEEQPEAHHRGGGVAIAGVIAVVLVLAIAVSVPRFDTANLHPFLPHGWSGVGSAAVILVWAFAGWEILSSLSAEYARPERDIGRATALTLGVVTALYLGIAMLPSAATTTSAPTCPTRTPRSTSRAASCSAPSCGRSTVTASTTWISCPSSTSRRPPLANRS